MAEEKEKENHENEEVLPLEFSVDDSGLITAFSAIGTAAGSDGAPSATGAKDILITPGTGNTLNQISQLDFKFVRASHPGDVTEPQDSEVKVTLYPYGERVSGDAYDSPALVIGGTWNNTRYAPSTNYISAASSQLATIWIHPRSGKIEASVFSAPSLGFNGLSLSHGDGIFSIKGSTDTLNGVPGDLLAVNFKKGTHDYPQLIEFYTGGDDVTLGDFYIKYGSDTAALYREIRFSGSTSGNWTFEKQGDGNTTYHLVNSATTQQLLSTNAVTTTLGDMYYTAAGATQTALTRLPMGSRSSVLVGNSASPVPTWLTPGTTGHTLIGSTTGDASWGVLGTVGGGTGTGTAFTIGSVIFAGSSGVYTQDNANLFWDDTNNTLGVGTTRSGAISNTNPRFRVKGSGTSSSTSSFEVQDSSGSSLFFVRDDGVVTVGVSLSILNAGTFALYESGSVNFSSFVAGTQSADLRYTLPTSQPSTNQVLTATAVSGAGPYDITLGWSTPSGGTTIGSSVSGGTAGSILFVGAGPVLAQDNANFYWDDTNNTLGVGTTRTGAISGTNPSVRILGTGTSSATSSFEIQDSGANTILFVRNDGAVTVGTNTTGGGIFEAHKDQNNDTYIAVRNATSGTLASASIRFAANSGGYGHIKATSDAFTGPVDWAEGFVVEAHTLQTAGLWLVAYTNSITLATTATNAYDLRLEDDGTVGFGLAPSAHLHAGRNLSLNAWGTGGAGLRFDAATYTDASSSGTVTSAVAHGLAQPTFAASNTTTYTDAASLYISNAPSAGTNVTITNAYALWIDSGITRLDGNVQVRTLSSGRVVYAGTNGLLQDSANMTFDGSQLVLSVTGSTGGLLIGGDANLYRSAANTLKTDDSFVVGVNLSVLNAGTFSLYESGSVNFSSFVAGTQANDIRYTLPTTQPSTNQILSASVVSGSGPYDVTLSWVTPATSGITIGDGITGSTVGSVLFIGAGSTLAQDNANFFWDDTNNTLGIGTTRSGAISGTNPSVRILGTGTSSATSSFEVQNSSAATILFVRNDGRVAIGTNTPSGDLSFGGEAARTITVERRGTGAGNNLTIQSGGAQSGASNTNGGNLILSSGISTGGGSSAVDIKVSGGIAFGSSDNTPTTTLYLTSSSASFYTSSSTYTLTLAPPFGILVIEPYTFDFGMVAATNSTGYSLNIHGGNTSLGTDDNGGDIILTAGNSTGSGSSKIDFYTATAGSSGATVRTSSLKMTLTGAGQLQVSTTGISAGLLLGGDALLYRSAADTFRTPDSLIVDASLTVGTLSSGRVTYAGTGGLLQDSANMTFNGNQLSLVTAGSSGGLLIGSDVQIYRASANTMSLAASDSLEIPSGNFGVGQTAPTSGSRVGITYNATVGSGTERAVLYTGTVSAAHTGFYNIVQSEGSTTNSTGTVNWIAGALNRVRAQSTGGTVSVIYGLHNLAWMDSASGTPTYTSNVGVYAEAVWSNASFTGTATVGSNTALSVSNSHTAISGGGTVAISNEYGLLINASVATGVTVTTRYGARINDPGGAGTLTTQYGLYLEDLDRASTNYGIYFAGTSGLSRQGIWWNGDVNLYRSATDVLATDDHINLATSNREVRLSTSGFANGGILFNSNMRFSAHSAGGFSFTPQSAYTHTFSSNQVMYISASYSPSSASSGSMYGIYNGIVYDDSSTAGNFTGEIIGSNNVTSLQTYQSGSHTFNRGIAVKGYLAVYDDNSGSGAITTNTYGGWFEVNDEGSSARITNAYGLYSLLNTPYSANSQTRYGLYVDAMPDPGVFTGTTTAAIRLAGTGGARDGILFGSDTNIYRDSANTLKTDDSFIVGTNFSILNAGTFSLYESGSVNFSSFVAGTQAADLRYTLPTSQPSTNQVLTATAVSGTGPYDITLGWVTNSASITIGDVVNSGTVGSVLFVGAGSTLAQDNANFFWDDTNNTFGIGTTRSGAISGTNPSVRILGTGTSSATSSFEVQDSGTNTILFVRNDSRVGIGTNAPLYDLSLGGESARTVGVNRRGTGAGNNLTIQSGGAQSGGTDLAAGTLVLSSGTATGNAVGYVDIYSINNTGLISGTSDNPAVLHARFGAGRVGIGTSTLNYDITLHSLVSVSPYTYTIGMLNSTVSGGHSLNIQAGHVITTADLNGGNVILTAGNSTGSGSSNIQFYTATAGGSGVTVRTSSLKMTLTGAGQLQIPTTGSSAGILLGGDANLYRSAANILKTDDAFEASSFNKVAITAPATAATLTIADGATLTVSASATIQNGNHSNTNTGDETATTIHNKTGYTQSFLLMGA